MTFGAFENDNYKLVTSKLHTSIWMHFLPHMKPGITPLLLSI